MILKIICLFLLCYLSSASRKNIQTDNELKNSAVANLTLFTIYNIYAKIEINYKLNYHRLINEIDVFTLKVDPSSLKKSLCEELKSNPNIYLDELYELELRNLEEKQGMTSFMQGDLNYSNFENQFRKISAFYQEIFYLNIITLKKDTSETKKIFFEFINALKEMRVLCLNKNNFDEIIGETSRFFNFEHRKAVQAVIKILEQNQMFNYMINKSTETRNSFELKKDLKLKINKLTGLNKSIFSNKFNKTKAACNQMANDELMIVDKFKKLPKLQTEHQGSLEAKDQILALVKEINDFCESLDAIFKKEHSLDDYSKRFNDYLNAISELERLLSYKQLNIYKIISSNLIENHKNFNLKTFSTILYIMYK